jgi:Xaa-Pro aminopeptidase
MQSLENLKKAYSQVFISSPDYDSRAIYARRRQFMLKNLDSFCIFSGMPIDPGSEEAFTETWTRFVQEPSFLYLTGVNQAGCYLVLDPKSKSETLFVPRKNPFREFWVGKRLGYLKKDSDVARLTGIRDVRPVEEFEAVLEGLCKKYAKTGYAYALYFDTLKDDHNDRFYRKYRRFMSRYSIKLRSVAELHWKDRLVLGPERIADARVAQEATEKAFRAVLPKVKGFKNERELHLTLNYEMQMRSDGDLAFPTICAGGANACCLHYVKNDEQINKGDMILLDFGVRYGTLHSDISRTIPASGKFDPLQAMLYQIVLDSAREYQKAVRPGVSLREIGGIPWEFIMRELETRLVKGAKGKYKLLYEMRPHGVSHFIGEQIHEGAPGSRSLDSVLEPGMLISCEPGLYGHFEATIGGKRYSEQIGIRIEDDLLITKNGFENISTAIPKEIKEIEKLMKG